MKILSWITLLLAVCALSFTFYSHVNKTEIVYVQNGDVLQKYVGLKEATKIYEQKITSNQIELDTIIAEYERKVRVYETAKSKLSKIDRQNKEYLLRDEAQRIKNFETASKDELSEEHEQLLTGVLNQINAFAEIYAKDKGYDLVIGTTNSGNLLYGISD